ncbi:MAG: SpaA isopeptide-forming pilin-related protein, partial [Lachnospiraceae bacterium]|nr:SpaA isopeptide-forming pilin-related protein [Lachnospiraceae bacterium]
RSLICGLEETYEEPVQEAEPESQDTVEAQTEESAETTEVTDENFEEVVEELSEENGSEEAASEEAADTVGEGISRSFIIRALTEDGTPVFGIQYLIRNKEGEPVAEKQTDENGVCQLEDLAVGTYSMEETAGPDRIQWNTDAEPDSFRVSEQEAENEKTVTYAEIAQTGITAYVSWQNIEDQEIALPTIYLQLFKTDGSAAEVKELNSAPWSVTWDGLDETDTAGHAIDYSAKVVDENGLDYTPDGYVKEEEGLQITLTRRTEEAREDDEVTITKTDAEGTPVYGAEVTLFDGDDEIATYEGGTFTISTADPELQPYLPEADESKILYLRETKAPEGYEADLTSYPVLLTAMEEVSLEEDVFLTTMMYGVNAAEEESGNKRITIPEDTETISVSNKLKTNLTNADFHFDEDKVSTYDPGTSEADGVKRIVVKNPTYQSDGSAQSKDGWSVDDLGYIRFQNAGVLSGENVDVLLYIDRVEFGDWAGTAKNKHADNKTGEWIVFSEITDNTINFSGSVGGIKNNEAGKKVKESYFWYGSLKVYVTTKIVNAGTEETVDGEQFLQVVADMDINHSNNSATNTTGNFTVEGFRTLSGFTGEYYAWDAAIWNMESSNAGQMHFYANEASIKLNGRESYTKGAVYTMTEGPEFSSVYEEGDCGARYEVYMMQSPEINITKSVDPEEYVPGDIVTYTINVKMGTWLVDTFMVYNSMSITDNLPDGLTL